MKDWLVLTSCIVICIICAAIYGVIWESDLPMWLKIFLLK